MSFFICIVISLSVNYLTYDVKPSSSLKYFIMEVQSNQLKKYYTLKETPWYFGAHLNQARHNLFLVLNDLTIKLGIIFRL